MEDELIKFETAKLAKEKGFDIPCKESYWVNPDGEFWLRPYSYDRDRYLGRPWKLAPTQSLLQKWLREEHKIEIKTVEEGRGYKSWYKKKDGKRWVHALGGYTHKPTYEEALEKGLQEALKLINNI